MKISIVTPVYNDLRVARALDSILGQRHGHAQETIVVDAGSSDGTLEVLERYRNRLDVLISEPDRGIYDGMNKGIERATGDVIGILNADDRYADAHVLRDLLNAFQRHPQARVCYGNMVYLNDEGRAVRYWKAGGHRPFKWRLGWRPPHPTFFVRRDVYEQYGLFDLDFPIASDYELQLRLLMKHRVPSLYLNRTMVHMAPGGISNGSLGNLAKANLEALRAWRRNRLRGGQLVPLFKPISKVPQFFMHRQGILAGQEHS